MTELSNLAILASFDTRFAGCFKSRELRDVNGFPMIMANMAYDEDCECQVADADYFEDNFYELLSDGSWVSY